MADAPKLERARLVEVDPTTGLAWVREDREGHDGTQGQEAVSVETVEDRRAYLADFGELVTSWTVGVAVHEDILVLLDNGTISQALQESVAALNRRATITLPVEDLPAGAGGAADTIVIGGISYHPKDPLPDGKGFISLTLEEA